MGGPHYLSFLATVRATLDPRYFGATLTDVIGWLDTLTGRASNRTVRAQHLARDRELWAEESTGIRRLHSQLPVLSNIKGAAVVVNDDIGRSLHPLSVYEITASF